MLILDDVIDPTPERLRLAAKLLSRVNVSASGCFEWTGGKDGNGYGNLYYRRGKLDYRWVRAH